jgi:hypothetical protein
LAGDFDARPIQLKAATDFSFAVDRKYERIPGLILVYAVGVRQDSHLIYAMTYAESVAIASSLGWTKTPSWDAGSYSTRHRSKRLMTLLEPYVMRTSSWERLFGIPR